MNFYFAVSKVCNLRCRYCYVPEYNKTDKEKYGLRALKATSDFIHKAKRENHKLNNVILHGAEPTCLSPHILGQIINIFFENTKSHVRIQTNGTLLTEDYLLRLLSIIHNPIKFRIGFSIDGPAKAHNINRCNSWELVTRNMFTALQLGFRVRILTVVTSAVVSDLPALSYWCKQMDKANISVVFKLAEHGAELDGDENILFADWLIKENRFKQLQAFRPNTCIHHGNNCTYFEFDIDGKVYSCNKAFMGAGFADWYKDSFAEIIGKRQTLYSERFIDPKCKDCPLWNTCNGGCPSSRVNGRAIDCQIKKYILEQKK